MMRFTYIHIQFLNFSVVSKLLLLLSFIRHYHLLQKFVNILEQYKQLTENILLVTLVHKLQQFQSQILFLNTCRQGYLGLQS